MKLKPCPFCGSAAKMIDDVRDGIFNYYKIFCTNIYCDAQMGWRTDADSVVKEWNRRVNDGLPDFEGGSKGSDS